MIWERRAAAELGQGRRGGLPAPDVGLATGGKADTSSGAPETLVLAQYCLVDFHRTSRKSGLIFELSASLNQQRRIQMGIAKKAVEGVTAPAKSWLNTVKKNPLAVVGILVVLFLAFRFRSQIMSLVGKIPVVGEGARKLSGEG